MIISRLIKSMLFIALAFSMLPLYANETAEEKANKIIAASKEYKDFVQFNSQLPVTFHTKRQPKVFVEDLTVKIIQPEYGFSLFEAENRINKHYQIKELVVLNKQGEITYLNFEPEKVADIEQIENYKKLKGLYISYAPLKNQILDLTAIENLTELFLFSNELSSLKLNKKNNIKTLAINLEPINIIENIKELNYLYLQHTNINNLDTLTNSKNLKFLRFTGGPKLLKIPSLSNFPKLHFLDFGTSRLTKIIGLADSHNLKHLRTSRYLNINEIKLPVSIELLDIGGKINKSFPDLRNLKKLKKLYFYGTSSTQISGLETLSNLEELDLSDNPIQKISGLDNLTNLKSLIVNDTNISKIEGLDSLKNLEELDLSHNKITKVEGLNKLDNIRTIKLDNNTITDYDLSEVEGLTTLRSITLDSNPFSDDLMNKDIKHWRKLYKAGKI